MHKNLDFSSEAFGECWQKASREANLCVMRSLQDVLGGKWKLVILSYLLTGTRRYGELKRLIPEISEKMLIQELRTLEHDMLVERKVYPEVPPRVEYSLTAYGQSLEAVFKAMVDWSRAYLQRPGAPPPPEEFLRLLGQPNTGA